MIIQNNLSAVNANRNLKQVNKRKARTTERLSSGYRVNRAADDAAALQISEKMRSQIRGLNQASHNAQDGISLLQTADGALNEMHSVLQRMRELSVKAGNDTNQNIDRDAISKEIENLTKEVDRIAQDTEYNKMKLFDGSLDEAAVGGISPNVRMDSGLLHFVGNRGFENLEHPMYPSVVVTEISDYTTTQSKSGSNTSSLSPVLAQKLETEIVPQTVNAIINTYPGTFDYLKDSQIGIGLKLYSDSETSTMAYVSMGTYSGSGHPTIDYTLGVNLAMLSIDGEGNISEDQRTELEATISHEMIHAFMDESITSGMIGLNASGSIIEKFPVWFKEGMAQTAGGGCANYSDWVDVGLGISTSSTEDSIKTALGNSTNKLTSETNASIVSPYSTYGTGYLACMYLGYKASGGGTVTSAKIADGLDKLLTGLASGKSLDTVINEATGYNTVTFQNNFATDGASFVKQLITLVGEGNGSLLTGNLADVDLLPNVVIDEDVFDLDKENDSVTNTYPSDVTVISGGSTNTDGVAPVDGFGEGEPAGGGVIDVSSIASGSGTGYTFDGMTLTITAGGDYTLKGSRSNLTVQIVDGVTSKIKLHNLNLTGDSTIVLEDGSEVTFDVSGTNSIKSVSGAGIHAKNDRLSFAGSGNLTVETESADNYAIQEENSLGDIISNVRFDSNSGQLNLTTITNKRIMTSSCSSSNTNAVLLQKDSECSTLDIMGNVQINSALDNLRSVFVHNGSNLTVGKNGSFSYNPPAGLSNMGSIINWGSIGEITDRGAGSSVLHYASSAVKSIEIPEIPVEGEKLAEPGASSLVVNYNGTQTTLNGTWEIRDKNNQIVSDPTAVTVGEDDSFTYKVAFTLTDPEVRFTPDMSVSEFMKPYMDSLGLAVESVDKEVSLTDMSVSGGGSILTITYAVSPGAAGSSVNGALKLQIGANQGQGMGINIDKLNAASLGVDALQVDSFEHAGDAISSCDAAINKVSEVRSRIGAYQNRLEHTIANLDNTAENVQASESRIRDMDMAKAMTDYSKDVILEQAAQAMLAQANRRTEGVLQLLG